jgi:AraC-like DNA-binding protein
MADPYESLPPSLREQGEDAFWTQELCRRFRPISFWHIRWNKLSLRELSWREVGEEGWEERSYHAEIRFGKEPRRDAYILKHLGLAARTGKPQWPSLFGVRDAFYPVRAGARASHAVLYAPQFLDEAPTPAFAAKAWSEISGRAASGSDPDYAHFARVLASLPVLGPAALRAFEAHLAYFAAFLAGQKRLKPLRQKALEMRSQALLPSLLPSDWVGLALGQRPWRPVPWHYERGIAPWVTEELGITEVPNACLALSPAGEGAGPADAVERFLELRRFQREAAHWARTQAECVAAPWEEHGVTLLAYAPGSEAQAQRHLQGLAQAARAWCQQRFGWRLRAGIGPRLSGGVALGPSWEAAVAALHRAVALDQDLGQAERQPGAPAASRPALLELKAALDGGEEGLRSSLELYLQAVLREGQGRLDYCRGLLQAAWQELLLSAARHSQAGAQAGGWITALDLPQLLVGFRQGVLGLGQGSRAGKRAPQQQRLRACLAFLKERYAEPLRLPGVAQRFGFSVPVFCRRFKAATGETLGQHLRRLRVEHAAQLLRSTRLELESIAKRSGFERAPALIRAFRQSQGLTPGAYRQAQALKWDRKASNDKK